MKLLILIGALAVVAVLAVGAWYLINNVTLTKQGKRK